MPAKKMTSDNRCERILKAARVEQGLTQSALAKRMKVSQGTVCNWEKNIGTMSLEKLMYYCQMLKLDINKIIALKETKP